MIGQNSIAAAVAVLGYDLATGKTWRSSNKRRWCGGFGLAGSAAALDTHVRLMAGQVEIGDFYNSSVGAVTKDVDMFPVGAWVEAGLNIGIIIDDAPVTNPINVAIDLQEY